MNVANGRNVFNVVNIFNVVNGLEKPNHPFAVLI
jgi:hypothetical protein